MDAKILRDEHGLWLVIEQSQLAGAVDWTHRFLGPGNNPVSADMAFAWPPATQWLARPFHDGGSLTLLAGVSA